MLPGISWMMIQVGELCAKLELNKNYCNDNTDTSNERENENENENNNMNILSSACKGTNGQDLFISIFRKYLNFCNDVRVLTVILNTFSASYFSEMAIDIVGLVEKCIDANDNRNNYNMNNNDNNNNNDYDNNYNNNNNYDNGKNNDYNDNDNDNSSNGDDNDNNYDD